MNNAFDVNAFLTYIGVEDHAVLSQAVTGAEPAFKYALNKLIVLKDWESVITNRLSPIRAMYYIAFPTVGASATPRFIELLMVKLIIEHYIWGDSFLPSNRYNMVRAAMMRLLPADMRYFPHEYTHADFHERVSEISARPNTRGKARLMAAAEADPQSDRR
jgi:hypothetical protein